MKQLVDLHLHSTASDGQYTPAELMTKVKEAGITRCALTDHDTIAGVQEARVACESLGIEFVAGIEISTKEDVEQHILGYNIDETNEELIASCEFFKNERTKRAKKIYQYLHDNGVDLELGSVERIAGSDNLGRPHFAQAMYEQGYVSNVREAFDKYLATPEFEKNNFRKYCTYKEAIELIHKAGGIAVLAHPGSTKKKSLEQMAKRIEELVGYGLDGIECYYSTHDREQTLFYLNQAELYDLEVTIGSDYHGEKIKPHIELGHTKEYMFDTNYWENKND
ncbi:MAG: PHP domain-containing protein [Erysipelotrichales bacterium]|nr:PHP domain-containing protein [Erysipelotrichales bacterium]